jgi:hypothetical protein
MPLLGIVQRKVGVARLATTIALTDNCSGALNVLFPRRTIDDGEPVNKLRIRDTRLAAVMCVHAHAALATAGAPIALRQNPNIGSGANGSEVLAHRLRRCTVSLMMRGLCSGPFT